MACINSFDMVWHSCTCIDVYVGHHYSLSVSHFRFSAVLIIAAMSSSNDVDLSNY